MRRCFGKLEEVRTCVPFQRLVADSRPALKLFHDVERLLTKASFQSLNESAGISDLAM